MWAHVIVQDLIITPVKLQDKEGAQAFSRASSSSTIVWILVNPGCIGLPSVKWAILVECMLLGEAGNYLNLPWRAICFHILW
jgi:hypothetical protein